MKPKLFSEKQLARWTAFTAATLGSVAFAFATPEAEPTADGESAQFIQMDLYHDTLMEGADTAVTLDGGIATLTGTANSLSQVERATARAFASPHVLTVVNQISILSFEGSNITESAEKSLRGQKMISAENISVSMNGSSLILEGWVGSVDESELAREIASKTPGVSAVENNLKVNFGSIRTDSQIAAQLEFIVTEDPIYSGLSLSPVVKDGIVAWSGEVGSRGEFDRLIRNSYVTGVIEVRTAKLSVNGDLKMEATEDKNYTASQCVEAFTASVQHDSRLDAAAVKAEMKNGVMVLSGTVPSEVQIEIAVRTARGIPGVLRVTDELEIETEGRFATNTKDLRSAAAPVLKR